VLWLSALLATAQGVLYPAGIAPAQSNPAVPIPPRHVRISAKVIEQGDARSWGFAPEKGTVPSAEWQRSRSSSSFFVLVADGQEARISVSESVPNARWFYQYSLHHGYIARGVVFQSVATGFRVIPTILPDDRIRLQITPEISYFTDQGQGHIAFVESRLHAVVANGQAVTVAANRHETESVLFNIMRGYESRTGVSTLSMTLTPEIQ
jgi:hypothetical protein